MKKIYSFLAVLAVPAFLITYSFTAGSPGGYSGSPLDGQNCTACHTTFDADTADWITTNIPEEGYTAGETYTITVNGMGDGVTKMGFEVTAETDFGKAGTWEITDSDNTQLVNADKNVTHTAAGTAVSDGEGSWSVDWVAPEGGNPIVKFYAAVNITNDGGTNDDDQIVLAMLEVEEVTTSIGQDILESTVQVYPNPASEYVNVATPRDSEVEVINFLGQVMLRQAVSGNARLDVSDYDQGIYFVRISHQGESLTKRIIVN